MSGPVSVPAFHRSAEVAAMLRCSEWWVKEQARKRRIPYAWIGGSYLFTDEHVAEIVRLFEVRPADPVAQIPDQRGTRHSRNEEAEASVVRLHARAPRRARTSAAEAVA